MDAAKTIVETLRGISGARLNITFSAEFGEDIVGREYKNRIIDAIKDAHWFMLLAPESQADSGWCLFESGMFRGNMFAPKTVNKLICIHREGSDMSPPPIDEYEAVKGNEESIRQFLINLLCKDNPVPGMPALNPQADKLMDWAVEQIVAALRRPTQLKRRYYQNFVRVTVPDTRKLDSVEDLDDLQVSYDGQSAHMFGKISGRGMGPHCWGELIENVREKDPECRWLQEVLAVMRKAADNNAFRPIQATLEEAHGGKVYRPVLHAMNYDENRQHPQKIFQINFIEEVGSSISAEIGRPIQALTTVLRMAYRFRWELIERFVGKPLNEESISELQDTMHRIEMESLSRGFMDEDTVCANFSSQHEVARIRALYKRWYEMRSDKGDGDLDKAFAAGDGEAVQCLLAELAKINVDFLRIATKRLQELSMDLPGANAVH